MYLSKHYVEQARPAGSGKIIYIASVAGLTGEPECELHSVYSAAKAGLIRFAECVKAEIQFFGMQAYVVVPCSMKSGFSETELAASNAVSTKTLTQLVFDIANSDKGEHPTISIVRPSIYEN